MSQQAVAILRRARKASTSFLRVEVSDSWVLLGRGAAQIGDGTTRKGAMRAGRGKRLVLRRGAESLGPSRLGDVAILDAPRTSESLDALGTRGNVSECNE